MRLGTRQRLSFVSALRKRLKIQWHSAQRSSCFHYLMQGGSGSCHGLQYEFRVAQLGATKGSSRRATRMIHCTHLPRTSVSRGLVRRLGAFRGKAIFFWLHPQTLEAPGGSMGCFGYFDSPSSSSSPAGQLLPIVQLGLWDVCGMPSNPAGTVPWHMAYRDIQLRI